ncbi:MAG TPA: M28 family peptidase [Thermoleophilaceae bacterium]|nr:M28 family peptidase [Thermoleophilaceae bacterium]
MSESTLREVVTTLAPLERGAGSEGEAEAARWLAERLQAAGAPARVESVDYRAGYARLLGPLGTAATIAGAIALTGRHRRLAALIAALAGLAIADDADNRWRVWRRVATRPRKTTNVVAEIGDLAAERTLVVLAHHDAAPTGWIFDQSLQRALARRFPAVIERANRSLPLWWPIVGAPLLVALGALANRRGLLATGTATGVLTGAVGADIARHRIVPGANDNLSGVAALVDLAERIRERPIDGLRVVLASCGAEEVLQGGIYDFVDRHLRSLDPARTSVLNLDTVGSPRLVLLEGEGVLRIEEYPGRAFRDLIAESAAGSGIPLVRDQWARSSTDSVIPSRAGYPTATITSFEPETKLLSNYHLPTDTPENVDFSTVRQAVDLTEALARRLASA